MAVAARPWAWSATSTLAGYSLPGRGRASVPRSDDREEEMASTTTGKVSDPAAAREAGPAPGSEIAETGVAYFDEAFVPLGEAKVSIATHALQYGTAVFEGIRGYWNERQEQLYVFRLREHFERMARSCRIMRIDLPGDPRAGQDHRRVREHGTRGRRGGRVRRG